MDVYAFGELLTAFRKHRRISQNDLAEKLDVHRNTIGTWERGLGLPESKTIVLELAKQLRLNDQETRQLLEASLTMVSPYWNVPYQRNPFFTGREEILQHLHEVLAHEHTAIMSQPYALSGLGVSARPRPPLSMPIVLPTSTLPSSGSVPKRMRTLSLA